MATLQSKQNPLPGFETVTPAEITVGQMESDNDPNWKDFSQVGTVYPDYKAKTRIEKDYHRYMMSITSPDGFQGAKTAFVQLGAPTQIKVVEFSCLGVGDIPDIPAPDLGGNWVLLDEMIGEFIVVTAPDGNSSFYRVNGYYIYGCKVPNTLTHKDIQFPLAPWLTEQAVTRVIPNNKVVAGITESFQLNNPLLNPATAGS